MCVLTTALQVAVTSLEDLEALEECVVAAAVESSWQLQILASNYLMYFMFCKSIRVAFSGTPWQLEGHELHMTSVRNENAYFSCIKDAPVGLGHGMAEAGHAGGGSDRRNQGI